MIKEELIEKALSLYKDGDKVDQKKAYAGNGNIYTISKVSLSTISITPSGDYLNVAIDTVGVYHSKYKIWAPVLNRPQESLLTRVL